MTHESKSTRGSGWPLISVLVLLSKSLKSERGGHGGAAGAHGESKSDFGLWCSIGSKTKPQISHRAQVGNLRGQTCCRGNDATREGTSGVQGVIQVSAAILIAIK